MKKRKILGEMPSEVLANIIVHLPINGRIWRYAFTSKAFMKNILALLANNCKKIERICDKQNLATVQKFDVLFRTLLILEHFEDENNSLPKFESVEKILNHRPLNDIDNKNAIIMLNEVIFSYYICPDKLKNENELPNYLTAVHDVNVDAIDHKDVANIGIFSCSDESTDRQEMLTFVASSYPSHIHHGKSFPKYSELSTINLAFIISEYHHFRNLQK